MSGGGRGLHFMAVSEAAQLILGRQQMILIKTMEPNNKQPNNIATYIKRRHQVYGGAFWLESQDALVFWG